MESLTIVRSATLIKYRVQAHNEATVNEQQLILVYINRRASVAAPPSAVHNTSLTGRWSLLTGTDPLGRKWHLHDAFTVKLPWRGWKGGGGQNVVSQFQYLYGHGVPLATRQQQQTPNGHCSAQSLISWGQRTPLKGWPASIHPPLIIPGTTRLPVPLLPLYTSWIGFFYSCFSK